MFFIKLLSEILDIPQPALALVFGLLLAVPSAAFFRYLLIKKYSASVRSLAVSAFGLVSGWCFCGNDMAFPLASIVITYLLCSVGTKIIGRKRAVCISNIFNFLYLCFGYLVRSSNGYDLSWTIPQSVLCLRLIGFATDLADAPKTLDQKSNPFATDMKPLKDRNMPLAWSGDLSLVRLPAFLHFFSYCLFPGAFLVGPQFSFRAYASYLTLDLYRDSTDKEQIDIQTIMHSSGNIATKKFFLGIMYIILSQVLGIYFNSEKLLDFKFQNSSFFFKLVLFWMTGKTALTKYLGVWLISESACVLSGLSYNGKIISDNGIHHNWDGLANILPWKFETATSLAIIIESFNVNTNHWAKIYVFKRLRFLGNKNLSAAITLLFLAIWHGFKAGYYFTFSLEFFDMEAERLLRAFCSPTLDRFGSRSKLNLMLVGFLRWLAVSFSLFYAVVSFDLLDGQKVFQAFSSVYFCGHAALLIVFGLYFQKKKMKSA